MLHQQLNTKFTMEENKTPQKYKMWAVDIDNRHKIPDLRLNGQQSYYPYGTDNAYPDYLIQLVNRSSVHATLVKQKAKFVFGNGMKVHEAPTTELMAHAENFLFNVNRIGQNVDDLNERAIMDMEIFNGFALKVVWSVLGDKKTIKAVYHMPFDSLRVDRDDVGVWHSNQWTEQQSKKRWNANYLYSLPPDAKFYPFFNPKTVGVKEYEQVYYFRVYNAQMKAYPLPEYISCNTDIEADIEISNFDLNNVKTGFAAGMLINMYNGIPSDDEARQLEKDIKAKTAGSDNAGQILINFTYPDQKGVEMQSFRPNDMADQYQNLKIRVRDAIFIGHQINNPMLFGIQVEGKLGGRGELIEAFEQFQNIYVNARQQAIENVWNTIISYHCDSDAVNVKIQHSEPIGLLWTDPAILNVMTKEEIRLKAGLEVIEQDPSSKNADQATIDAQAGLKGSVGGVTGAIEIASAVQEGRIGKMAAVKLLQDLFGFDEATAMLIAGYAPEEIAQTENFKSASVKSETEAWMNPDDDQKLLELFASCGEEDTYEGEMTECDLRSSEEAALVERAYSFARIPVLSITDPLQKLYDILTETPKMPLAQIAEKLSTPMAEVVKMLNDLQRLNVLDYETGVRGDKIEVKRLGPVAEMPQAEEGYKIFVKYKYFGPRDSKNRPFCANMLSMNRIYTREEIDGISAQVGYNVWLRRGGWYTDPTTGIARPSCRHTWMQKVIKERL